MGAFLRAAFCVALSAWGFAQAFAQETASSGMARRGLTSSTYQVTGASRAELVAAIRRNAPMGGSAYGIGFIDFNPSYAVARDGDACKVARAEVSTRIRLRVPEWRPGAQTPKAIDRLGRHFARSVIAHEMEHVRIAERYGQRMRAALLKLKPLPGCWDLRAAANALILRIKRDHLAAQRAFDRRTLKQIRRLI